ncbi:hypothetical protein RB10755 [Rhodopirellula baltica SH 1]|uniref:Uncharacterized protein n=1 Tax=Rhodopirellula baltica (strain DSM 10527 / NCIMB 13988 / SH1) TaxID=243090 RepID=Q7UKA4_RHOBA|nr:hypothetical protein RB10755 [Rhodopirellula baltica SH 1]
MTHIRARRNSRRHQLFANQFFRLTRVHPDKSSILEMFIRSK